MLVAAPALLALVAAQFPFVRETVEVASYPGFPFDGTTNELAVEDGKAISVWSREYHSGGVIGHHIWAAASADSGRSWSNSFRVDTNTWSTPRFLSENSVTLAGGRVQVCWMEGFGGNGLHFLSWPVDVRPVGAATPVLGNEVVDYVLRTSLDGQSIAILAHTLPPGGVQQLVVVRSSDGGVSFQAPVVLRSASYGVNGFGGFGGMDLELVGDELSVVWNELAAAPAWSGSQYFQRSDDGGATWLPSNQLLASGRLVDPDLVVSDDRLAVVGGDETGANRIAGVVSTDAGTTWSAAFQVSVATQTSNARRYKARAYYTPTHLVVAWADNRTGSDQPYVAWSDDAGSSWVEEPLHPSYGNEVQLAGDPETGNFAAFWNGAAQLYTKWSRSTQPNPNLTLVVDAGSTTQFENLRLRYDLIYNDFLCTWQTVNAAVSERKVWSAGFRTPQLEPIGNFTAGGLVSFVASGFPDRDVGNGLQVLVSSHEGAVDLPNGDDRHTGLGLSRILQQTASSSDFRGQVGVFGGGATGPLLFPPTIPPGTVLHCAAVSFTGNGAAFGSMTDYVTIVVQ